MRQILAISVSMTLMALFASEMPAVELQVTHSTAGLVFEDNFNSDTLGALPVIGAGDTGSGWAFKNDPETEVDVTNGSTEGISAVDQFLATRNVDGVSTGGAAGGFGQVFTTGTVTAEFSAYIPTGPTGVVTSFQNSGGGFVFNDGLESWTTLASGQWASEDADLDIAGAGVAETDGVLAYFDGGAWSLANAGGSTLTFALDKWVDVVMTYDLDASSLGISIDGVAADFVSFAGSQLGEAQAIVFRLNSRQGTNAYFGGNFDFVPGDVDGNGEVNIDDFNIILQNYGMTGATVSDGDVTFDGVVDLFDFKEWKTNAGDFGNGMSIPEPATLTLLFTIVLLLVGSRKHRHASQ